MPEGETTGTKFQSPLSTILVFPCCVDFEADCELPPDDHRKWQEEEAALVERDRTKQGSKGGLFRGCFRAGAQRPLIREEIIRDVEDGVNRCPSCAWELEGGHCFRCGYGIDSDFGSDYEGLSPADSDDNVDADADADAVIGHLYPYDDIYSADGDEPISIDGIADDPPHRVPGYRIVRPDVFDQVSLSDTQPTYDSFLEDTEGDSEEDGEEGSLNGFVVNDESGVHFMSDGNNNGFSSDSSVRSMRVSDGDIGLADPEDSLSEGDDDSDEGPIAPSRRHLSRILNDSRGTTQNQRQIHQDRNRTGPELDPRIPHRHQRLARGQPVARKTSIEVVESDSDAPIPPQRSTRRPARGWNWSDEESEPTATAHLQALQSASLRDRSEEASSVSRTQTPIFIGLSPVRPQSRESSPLLLENFGATSQANEESVSSKNVVSPSANLSPSSAERMRPRSYRRTSAPRASISPMRAEERNEQAKRDQRAQKAERKANRRRIKAEREQRQQASPRFSS